MFTLLSTKVSWNVKRLNYYIDHETEFTFFFNKLDDRNLRKNNEGYEIHWFLYEKSIKENTITPNFTRLFYTENLREKVADHKKFSKSLWIFFLMSSETSSPYPPLSHQKTRTRIGEKADYRPCRFSVDLGLLLVLGLPSVLARRYLLVSSDQENAISYH